MNFKSVLIAALAAAAIAPAFADEIGRHPAYLHASSDLQVAAWQVDHRRPEDARVSEDETIVRDEIAAAIVELRHAAWQDGKPLEWSPPPDIALQREGRLHATVDLLRKVRSDVAREEDDPRARPAQQRGLAHVDAALSAAQHAIDDVRRRERRE